MVDNALRNRAANPSIGATTYGRSLDRYKTTEGLQPVGTVRLQDDAAMGPRILAQAAGDLAQVTGRMVAQAEAEYVAKFSLDHRAKAAELAGQHRTDPDGFLKAWEAHAEGASLGMPAAFRKRATLEMQAIGTREYEGIVGRTAAVTEANAKQAWGESGEVKTQEYLSLVRAGKGDTPEGVAALEAVSAHLGEGVRLKVLDPEAARIHVDRVAATADAEAIKLRAVDAFRRGGRAAADKVLKQLDTDPDIAPLLQRRAVTAESIRAGAETEIRSIEAQIAAARRSAVDGVQYQLWRVRNGLEPDPEKLKQYAAAIGPADKSAAGGIVRTLLNRAADVAAFRELPIEAQGADLAATKKRLEDPKASEDVKDEFATKAALYSATLKDFERDPFATLLRFGPGRKHQAAPADLSDADFVAKVQARRTAADEVSVFQRMPVVPLFAAEKAAIAARLRAATPSDYVAIVGTVGNALGPYADRFWAELASGKEGDGARLASVAKIADGDRGLAADIVAGRMARQVEPKYAPKSAETADAFFSDETGNAFKYLPPQARETMKQEFLDLYAKAAKDEGDTSGEFVPKRAQAAFRRRFGLDTPQFLWQHDGASRFPTWKGVRVMPLPPVYDHQASAGAGRMGRSYVPDRGGISEWMATLTDADMGGALPIDPATGRRISADVIRRYSRIYSVGTGRYFVEVEGRLLAGRDGRPFVLDWYEWKRRQDGFDARTGSADIDGPYGERRPTRDMAEEAAGLPIPNPLLDTLKGVNRFMDSIR